MNKLRRFLMKSTAAVLAAFMVSSMVFAVSANLSNLQEQQRQVTQRQTTAREALAEARRQGSVILAEILEIEVQLEEVTEAHEAAYTQLQETRALIEQTAAELYAAEIRREAQYEAHRESLRFVYKRGTLGYFEILLSSRSFGDIIRNLEYINRIVAHDNQILDELLETERVIADSLAAIRIMEIEQALLENELYTQAENLEQIMEIREEQLLSIRGDEARHDQALREMEAESNRIGELIRAQEAEIARQEAARRAELERRARQTPAQPAPALAANAQMLWPVSGHTRVSSGFGYRNRPIGSGREFHRGIDIPAPTGTNIVAAEGGTVTFSGWMGGFGNTVIILHANNLSTLYAHNSRNLVSEGQQVRRGDRIALVGSTGMSTGPHLHFEVRRNGSAINPNPFLGR